MAQIRLDTSRGIAALEAREKPYWQAIPGERGRAIGVRRTEHGTHWLCRSFDARKRQYKQVALTQASSYNEARKMAEEIFKHEDGGGERSRMTVSEWFNKYCDTVAASTSHSAVRNTLGKLGEVRLCDLHAGHVQDWRNSDLFTKNKEGEPRPVATLRRMAAPLKAALNMAVADGFLADVKWREKVRFTQKKAEAAQVTTEEVRQYLTPAQRRALIEHAREDFKLLLTLCCAMPVRPGDFPAANVKDFDAKAGTVFLSTKDHPRHAKLAPALVKLLEKHAEGRKPNSPLFTVGETGKRWHRNQWREALLEAAQRANVTQAGQGIPEGERVPLSVSMYDLRHSAINDALEAGHSVAQVAILAATSIAMIDANYKKVLASVQKAALDSLAASILG